MSQLKYVNSFRDLLVYQKSRKLALSILVATKRYPKEEAADLLNDCEEIGRLLGGIMAKAHIFCRPKPMRESGPNYFTHHQ